MLTMKYGKCKNKGSFLIKISATSDLKGSNDEPVINVLGGVYF